MLVIIYSLDSRIEESSEQSLRHTVNLNVKAHVGLDQCNACLVGGAPLATEVKEYFKNFDILIGEVSNNCMILGMNCS